MFLRDDSDDDSDDGVPMFLREDDAIDSACGGTTTTLLSLVVGRCRRRGSSCRWVMTKGVCAYFCWGAWASRRVVKIASMFID